MLAAPGTPPRPTLPVGGSHIALSTLYCNHVSRGAVWQNGIRYGTESETWRSRPRRISYRVACVC
eukprot:832413-Prymnesium_polylepis.1